MTPMIGTHPLLRATRRQAFVLLEVLVSLAIIGVTFAMVLNSFTISMKAARSCDERTQASVLAHDLIEEWEVKAPQAGQLQGPFDGYPEYSYKALCDPEQPAYPDVTPLTEGRLALLRQVSLEIYYQPRRAGAAAKRVLHVETALSAAERFGPQAEQNQHTSLSE